MSSAHVHIEYVCFIHTHTYLHERCFKYIQAVLHIHTDRLEERWGAGVETQKNVREEIGGWGRVPFNEPYAPLVSTIYDGA